MFKKNGFQFDFSQLTDAARAEFSSLLGDIVLNNKRTDEKERRLVGYFTVLIKAWPYQMSPQDLESYNRLGRNRKGKGLQALFRAIFEVLAIFEPDAAKRETMLRHVKKLPRK